MVKRPREGWPQDGQVRRPPPVPAEWLWWGVRSQAEVPLWGLWDLVQPQTEEPGEGRLVPTRRTCPERSRLQPLEQPHLALVQPAAPYAKGPGRS